MSGEDKAVIEKFMVEQLAINDNILEALGSLSFITKQLKMRLKKLELHVGLIPDKPNTTGEDD